MVCRVAHADQSGHTVDVKKQDRGDRQRVTSRQRVWNGGVMGFLNAGSGDAIEFHPGRQYASKTAPT